MKMLFNRSILLGFAITLSLTIASQATNISPTVTTPLNNKIVQTRGHGHGHGHGGWGWGGGSSFGFQLFIPAPVPYYPAYPYHYGPVCHRECSVDRWGNYYNCHRVCY